MQAVKVHHNTARVAWKHFQPDQKRFVDGVQLRYLVLKDGNLPISQVKSPYEASYILYYYTTRVYVEKTLLFLKN